MAAGPTQNCLCANWSTDCRCDCDLYCRFSMLCIVFRKTDRDRCSPLLCSAATGVYFVTCAPVETTKDASPVPRTWRLDCADCDYLGTDVMCGNAPNYNIS